MKTIKEAAKSPEFNRALLLSNPHQVITKSFESGVEFAQRWISVEDELPHVDPDFEFSEMVLTKVMDTYCTNRYHSGLKRWSSWDMNVTHWRPIELK